VLECGARPEGKSHEATGIHHASRRYGSDVAACGTCAAGRPRTAHAVEVFALEANGALLVLPDLTTNLHHELIIRLAARYKLPAMYAYRDLVKDGGLISYGVDTLDQFRVAATYVDRILKGAKPADLPVQAPNKFDLVINLKTAKALGLTVPLTLQAAADEVIE
jgi:putative ABC transport system substrate-binding protein